MKPGQVPEVLIALVATWTVSWDIAGTKSQSICDNALGMESGAIKDSQITVSSSHTYPSNWVRLNFYDYWISSNNQRLVKVDLLRVTVVSKIALQGFDDYYTQTFAIHHSLDGLMWTEYKSSHYDGYGAEALPGVVTSNNVPVNYTFIPTFEARFVVVQPLTHYRRPVMRMELYGCPSRLTVPVATNVSADIVVSSEWTSTRSPYIISSMVTVTEGVTLTIRAGTSVIFTKNSAGLIIDGELIVTGSLNQKVYLMSHNPSLYRESQWQGIIDSKGVIKLSHTVIKNAVKGLGSYAFNTTISDTTFIKNEVAVEPLNGASDSSHVFIDNSNFVDNYRGVYISRSFSPSSHFLLKNCHFQWNEFGFEMSSVSSVDIKLLRTTFTNNIRALYANVYSRHCRFYGEELDFRDNSHQGIEYIHRIPDTTSLNNSFDLINSNFYQNRYCGLYLYVLPDGVSTYTAKIANNQFNGMFKVNYGVWFKFQPYDRSTPYIRLDVSNNTFTAHNYYSLHIDVAENVRIASHLLIDGNHFSKSLYSLYIGTLLKNTVKNTARISRNAFYAIRNDPAVVFDMAGAIVATNNSFINCTSRVVLDVTRNAENVILTENIFSNPAAQINLRVNPRATSRVTKMHARYNYWGYNDIGEVRRHISDFFTDFARVLVEITPWYTDPNRDVSSQDELIFDPRDACLGGILNSNVTLASHAIYNICLSIYIPPGYTLTIGQASQLVFRAGLEIFSQGSLKLIESPENRTVFRSATTGHQSQWKGISIHNNDNTQWNGVDIHNATEGLTITFDRPTIISLTNLTVTGARHGVALTASSDGSLFIHESLFSSCLYRGIELTMTKLSKEFVFNVTYSRFLNNQGHAMYIQHEWSSSARMVVNLNNITGIGNQYGTYVQSEDAITDLTLENCHFSRGSNYDFKADILPRKIVIRKNRFINGQYGAYIDLNKYGHSEACEEGIVLESNVFLNYAPTYYDVYLQLNAREYPSCFLRMIDNDFTRLSGQLKPAVYIDGRALVNITVANNSFTGSIEEKYVILQVTLYSGTRLAYIYGNRFNRGGHALNVIIVEASAKVFVLSNTFTENSETVFLNFNSYYNQLNPVHVSGNTFTNNTGRVLIANQEYFHLNYNIFNNPQADFNVALTGGTSAALVNASFNFWGTTNKKTIQSKILDYLIDNNLPRVEFEPYMSGHNLTDIFVGITPFISPNGEIGGELIGNATLTLANSPYHAITSIIIAKGAELTVEAGVVIECDENVAIDIYGRLTCLGEGDMPVVFKSKGSKPWVGINIYSQYSLSQVRLQDGPNPWVGRLEVKVAGIWGTVCGDKFGMTDARVACAQLGYPRNKALLHTGQRRYAISDNTVPVLLHDVHCNGSETTLTDCTYSLPQSSSTCYHHQDVTLDCMSDATSTPWTSIPTSQGPAVTDGKTDKPKPLTEEPVTQPAPTEIPVSRRLLATQNDIFTSRLVNVLISNTQQGVRISGIIPEISNVTLTHSNADLLYIKTSWITPYIRLTNVSAYNAKQDGISIELQQTGNTDVTIVNSNVARAQRHCISLRNSGNFAIDSSNIYSCGQMAIHSSSYVKGHWQLTNSEMWDNYHYLFYMKSGSTQGNMTITIDNVRFHHQVNDYWSDKSLVYFADVYNSRFLFSFRFINNMLDNLNTMRSFIYIGSLQSNAMAAKVEFSNNSFINNSITRSPLINIPIATSHDITIKMYGNIFRNNLVQNWYYKNPLIQLMYNDWLSVSTDIIENEFINNVVKFVIVMTMNSPLLSNKTFITRNKFMSNEAETVVNIRVNGAIVQDNVFVNPDSPLELSAPLVTNDQHIASLRVDARRNYWGVNNVTAVNSRIASFESDMRRWVVYREPFYLSKDLTMLGNVSAFIDGDSVGGLVDGDTEIPMRARPYTVDRSILVSPGRRLKFDGVKLEFLTNRGIFVEGNGDTDYENIPWSSDIDASKSELRGSKFLQWKGIFISQKRWYTNFVRLDLGPGPNEGILVLTLDQNSGYVCQRDFDLNNANVVCRMLGYLSGVAEVIPNAYSVYNASYPVYWNIRYQCNGRERSLLDCAAHQSWCSQNAVAGMKCYGPRYPLVSRSTSDSQLAHTLISGASTGLHLMTGNINITGVTIHNAAHYGILATIDSYYELDLHGSRVTECREGEAIHVKAKNGISLKSVTVDRNKDGIIINRENGSIRVSHVNSSMNTRKSLWIDQTQVIMPSHVTIEHSVFEHQVENSEAVTAEFCNYDQTTPQCSLLINNNVFSNNSGLSLKVYTGSQYSGGGGNGFPVEMVIKFNTFDDCSINIIDSNAVSKLSFENNNFMGQTDCVDSVKDGCLLRVDNREQANGHSMFMITENKFKDLTGRCAVSLSSTEGMIGEFLFNQLTDNKFFSEVLKLETSMYKVTDNIFDNRDSPYEIQVYSTNKNINATNNWFGSKNLSTVEDRLYHKNDSENRARLLYVPIMETPTYDCSGVANCSNNGECVRRNRCRCNYGYKGVLCNKFDCSARRDCNDHGSCTAPQKCSCIAGWRGRDCIDPVCDGLNDCLENAGRGFCVGPNKCQCGRKYSGDDCSGCAINNWGPLCLPCPGCVNGVCDKNTGECICSSKNWRGTLCNRCAEKFYGPQCLPLPKILDIVPSYGPDIGGKVVNIEGHNFEPMANNTYYCRFGCCTKVKGVRLSDEHIQCITPKLQASNYYVEVSPDGVRNFTSSWLVYTFYARCPKTACGFQKKPSHGRCTFGQCVCNHPWTGDDCQLELLKPIIIPPPNVSVLERNMYSVQVNLTQGNATLYWSMTPRLLGLTFDSSNGLIEWQSAIASATPYTFTVRVSNNIGSDVASWTVTVPLSYSAIIDNISPSGVLPSPKSVLVTGHVVFVDPRNTAKVVAVNVKLSNKGRIRTVSTLTGSLFNGEFVTWVHPRSSDSGTVLLGAHHPADRSFKAQKSWSVQRMITDPSYSLSYSTDLFDRNKITIPSIATLVNDGVDDILNVTVTISGTGGPLTSVHAIKANSMILTLTCSSDSNMFITNLSAGQRVPFDLLLTLTGPLSSSLVITFLSSRGTYVTLRAYLSITVRKPWLVLDPGSIRGNILIGSQKSYDIVVKNVGLVRANDVKVSLPIDSHFSISSFSKMNSTGSQLTLDPNEEATLTMTVTVNRGEPLGEIRGSIAIVSLTGGVSLRYHFFIVSDNKVNLTIVTEDEFTYFASNKPPLANATVRLWSRKQGVDISYITDETGIVVFENICEDMYSLSGSADGHGSKHTTILLTNDSKHTFVHLFLPRIAVKYTFTVKPTTFEDKYIITLESTFETQVPMPVVTIKPNVVNLIPYKEGKKDLMDFEVSNHGLIRADNVRFELPTNHPSLKFNLTGDLSRHLDANTTVIIQVGVSVRKVTKRNAIACGFINNACGLKMLYDYVCNGLVTRSDSVNLVCQVPSQPPHPYKTVPHYYRSGAGGTRGSSGGGRPASSGSVTVYNPITPMSCKCAESLILNCLLAFHPLGGCAIATRRLAAPGGKIAWEIADFAMACGVGVVFPIPGALYKALSCLMAVYDNCRGGSSGQRRRAISSAVVNAAIDSAVPMDNFVKLTEEVFGGKDIFFTRDDAWVAIFKGAVSDDSDADQILTENEHRQIMAAVKATDAATISKFLTRWNKTMTVWKSGATPSPEANVMSRSFLQSHYTRFVRDNRDAKKAGHDSIFAQFDKAVSAYNKQKKAEGNKPDEGICAKARVRILQEQVLAGNAFNARLEIENGAASMLEDIKVTIRIQDSLKPGIIVNHLFDIAKPKLVGITAVDGTGSLAKSVSGSADWLMAPHVDSARSVDVLYQVGGRLSYRVGDSSFSVSLLPDTITVKPTPSLEVRYYHQKYVFGDDAMTKDIVEPIEPFFLAMTIANVGYGMARSVRITSAQPEIIENEKGLLITFEIIGSQLGNKPATKSLKMNIGDIEASETKAAKWILTSTLSGKFYNLTATFENINPFGDPELSILDVLEYHELFQLVFIEGEDDLDDFLVNDVIDEFVPQVPDRLCSSYSGSLCYYVFHTFISSKHPLTSQSSGRYVTVTVVVETADSGWMYTRIEDDPVIVNALAGDRRLLVVNRIVDDKTLLVGKNAWVTTRIEDKVLFHMLDYLPGRLQRNDGSMQYNLTVYELLFGPNITTTTSISRSTTPKHTASTTPLRISMVLRIRPNSGTNRGGDVVRVFGEHFDVTSDNTYFCRFSSTLVTGTRISSEEIRCVAPAVDPQFEGMVTVEVSPDGTNNFTSSQVMYKYYIPCSKSSCGSEFTPTRGSCIFGTCRCNLPWSGDGCDIEIMRPVVIQPPGVTLNEAQRYTVNVTLSQGDKPLTWRIQNNLPGLFIDSQSGQVLWTMAVASQQPYTFTVVVTNQIGSDSATWVVTVPLSYSVFIDTIEPGGALPYPQPIDVSGHFVFNKTFDPQPPLIAVLMLSNNDEVRMKTVYGDDAGRLDFKTVLYPRSSDGGKFLLGAHHPADTIFYPQKEYSVKKMILSKSSISLSEYLDGRSEIRLSAVASLSNVGVDPIPNISVTVEGVGGPLTSAIIVQQGSKQTSNLAINSLKPGQAVSFDLVLTVSAPLISSLAVTFTSSEGTVAFMSASISLNQRLPLLSLNVLEIRANIEIGTQETFDVLIRNDGNTTAKNIQISLPDRHMSLVSFAKDGDDSDKTVDLAFGEIATLSFSVTVEPTEGFGFITGDIVISAGGARSSLQYRFDFVSMKTDNLTVKIEDEFTYFAKNGPRVSGATVVLINPRRGIHEVLITPESGIVVFSDIVEDQYTIRASADGHSDAQVTVLVTSTDRTLALFLQRIAVKYTWTVTPTTIPDKYIIQLESTFETNVPMPVVTVKPKVVDIVPYEKGEKTEINFIVTNHGLIAADNIRFNLPTNHESLIFTEVGEAANHISPNTSIIITVNVTRRDAAVGRRKRGVTSCLRHFVCALEMLWDYTCNGPRSRMEEITLVRGGGGQPRPCYTRIHKNCGTQRSRSVLPRTVCHGCYQWRRRIEQIGGISSFQGNIRTPISIGTTSAGISTFIRPGRSSSTTYNPTRPMECDCLLAVIVDCGLAFHPIAGCAIAGEKVIHQGNDDIVPLELMDLLMACGAGSLGAPYTAVRCLLTLADKCGGRRRKRAVTRAVVESAIQSSDAMDNFFRLVEEVLGGTSLLYMEDTSWYTVFKEKITDYSDAGRMLTDAEHAAILASVNATSYRAGVTRLLDRWNNTMSVWNGGQTMSLNVMDKSVVMSRYEQYSRDTRDAVKDGSQSIFGKFQHAINTYNKQKDDENKKGDGVCAKVRVRIEQELVLTRSAFKARLEIENGEKSDLEGIMVTIEIRDTSRPHVVTTHLFSIGDPKLVGLTGVNGTGSLRRDTTGSAEWLMVPYPNSTQSADILYSVGGRLSYRVGAANFSVTLMPDTITVRPTPILRVRYFLPMYVFGDDPMTPEVEAVEKFNLAMMVSNEGHGTARDVRITSAQPKIVENEKELLVTFKIIGAKLDNKTMSRTLKVEFGDIEPFMTKRADWVMTSSLSGKFYNLSATFVNINPLGDPDLSILDVEYHELFRVVRMPDDDYKGPHFLVNGKIDENIPQIPDRLYSSTNVSRVYDVYRAFLIKISQLQFTLKTDKYRIVYVTLNLTNSGWFYARVEHDLIALAHNTSHLLWVKRNYKDPKTPRENAWITSRMEKRILFHLLDYADDSRPSDEVTYHLIFGSKQTSATARISYVAWSGVILAVSFAMQIACIL